MDAIRKVFGSATASSARDPVRQIAELVRTVNEAMVTLDAAQRIVSLNPAAEHLLCCKTEDVLGQALERFVPEGLHAPWEALCRQPLHVVDAPAGVALHNVQCARADGEAFTGEVSMSRIAFGRHPVPLFVLVLRDVTRRIAPDAEVARLNRLYAALCEVSQAIVATTVRDALYTSVCRGLVEQGAFCMAWVGWLDGSTRRIVPVASWGDENNYLTGVIIYADDRPEGRGPSGRAFRSGRPHVCNDILMDPATLPWREAATQRGLRACAAFPILLKDRVSGLLNVYAAEADYFQDREVALLTQTAADLSFALENFAREEERSRALAEARREQVFSATMLESLPGIVYFYDAQGHFLRWNRNFEVVSGYSAAEIARMHPLDFFGGEDKAMVAARIADVLNQGEAVVEAPFLSRDGRTTPYLLTGKRIFFDGAVCVLGMGIDISDHRPADAALRALRSA